MIKSPSFSSFRAFRLAAGVALLGLFLLPCSSARAANDNQLDEKTSTELAKLAPLIDAKNWDGALALLNKVLAQVGPDSYDAAFVSDIVYKLYMQKSDYVKAIAPLEDTLRLADTHPTFFDANHNQELVLYLAKVYYQEAADTKSPATKQQYYSKASFYIQRWLKASTLPKTDQAYQDGINTYANILYQQAALKNPADPVLLAEVQKVIHEALLYEVHPKENYYILLLATYQQQNDLVHLSELLEYILKVYPSKKDYWPQLFGLYLNLAASAENDPVKAHEYQIRAILTAERAQSKGQMTGPKDYMNLVSIYFSIGQFGKATDILHDGLKNGTIEQVQKNWELLAYSFQQINQPFKAIEVLKEAVQQFPNAGQLDYQIAQIYYSLDKGDEAYTNLKTALAKGHLDKPAAVNAFMAYVCFELRKLDEALAAANKAIAHPDGKADAQLPKLKQAIEDAIKERSATTEALKKTK